MSVQKICSTFSEINIPANQDQIWDTDIANLKADEKQNPDNIAIDQQDIDYYEQLKANRKELQSLAAAYRKSDNDPVLAKKIEILNNKQQTLNQLLDLDSYIKELKADTKINPEDSAANAKKIQSAEEEKDCIQKIQTAWEAYEKSGNEADKEKAVSLAKELQGLINNDSNSPLFHGLIWQDRIRLN